jgi:hypothetical protein
VLSLLQGWSNESTRTRTSTCTQVHSPRLSSLAVNVVLRPLQFSPKREEDAVVRQYGGATVPDVSDVAKLSPV